MTDGFTSTAASRFLRYVTFDTQSSDQSDTYPSTAKQLVLLNQLVDELKAMGVADAAIDQHGYVMASIPAHARQGARAGRSASSPMSTPRPT